MPSKPVYVPFKKNGNAHPKCYLGETKGCSEKISGEHCISHNLLNKIEKSNHTIDIAGLRWLPPDHVRSIGKARLVANVLCANHNEELSGLDAIVGDFVDAVSTVDDEFKKDAPKDLRYTVDGSGLERWALKTLIGLVESQQIRQESGQPFSYDSLCLRLLCLPGERWPLGWGLYAAIPDGHVYHSASFELTPQFDPGTGKILALALKFNGIGMRLVIGKADNPGSIGIHRPSALVFKKGTVTAVVQMSWNKVKPGSPVVYSHVGTYRGTAPGHDLPRASDKSINLQRSAERRGPHREVDGFADAIFEALRKRSRNISPG